MPANDAVEWQRHPRLKRAPRVLVLPLLGNVVDPQRVDTGHPRLATGGAVTKCPPPSMHAKSQQ